MTIAREFAANLLTIILLVCFLFKHLPGRGLFSQNMMAVSPMAVGTARMCSHTEGCSPPPLGRWSDRWCRDHCTPEPSTAQLVAGTFRCWRAGLNLRSI